MSHVSYPVVTTKDGSSAPGAPMWKSVAYRARKQLADSIPTVWRLPASYEKPETDFIGAVRECGILSPRQLGLTELTASDLLPLLHTGELTATELTEAFCARAAVAHQLVNCLTDFYPEEAIAIARELDAQFSKTRKPTGLLHGLPIAIKDTYAIKGKRTTNACAAWYDQELPTESAALVQVMEDAGAVIFARTTMPQTGMALETVSPLWGRTLNPYNSHFGSGGSSGGDGALVAMRGTPCAPIASDVGGSIRAPAAFNGLYGMRPSSDRSPRTGLMSERLGLISIKAACGPIARSFSDLKLLAKLVLTHPSLPYEPSCVLPFWHDTPTKTKLIIGLMSTDGVVDPHPPVARALREIAAKLEAAGHEVITFQPPVDLWEASLVTWKLYFPTGASEVKRALASTGEPLIPQFEHHLEALNVREHTTAEIGQGHVQLAAYKRAFVRAWNATTSQTKTGQPIDCILAPSAPLAGSPHDFPLWWGYTSIWNLLDYPSTILPMKDFKIDVNKDPKDHDYQPRANPFDKRNWEIYDPELWKTQPMTFQVVGRNCRDEELLSVSEVVDGVINQDG